MLWDSPTREAEASGVFPGSSRQELASLGDGTWAEQVALDFSWLLPPNWLMVAQMVKHLPAMQETQVPSLGQEDPLEEGNGNPLQYSCLEDPMDRGAWRATIHGFQKTQLSDCDFTIFPPNCSGDSSCWAATPHPPPPPRMEQRNLRGGCFSFPCSFSLAFCVSTAISIGISLSLWIYLILSIFPPVCLPIGPSTVLFSSPSSSNRRGSPCPEPGLQPPALGLERQEEKLVL